MRLLRSDLVPLLAIIAGGAIGMATFGSVMAPSEGQTVEQNFSEEAIQLDEVFVTGTRCPQRRVTRGSSASPVTIVQGFSGKLIFVDGERFTCRSLLDDVDPNDIESIEIVKGPAAAAQFGEEASEGAVVIMLKEEARRRR